MREIHQEATPHGSPAASSCSLTVRTSGVTSRRAASNWNAGKEVAAARRQAEQPGAFTVAPYPLAVLLPGPERQCHVTGLEHRLVPDRAQRLALDLRLKQQRTLVLVKHATGLAAEPPRELVLIR